RMVTVRTFLGSLPAAPLGGDPAAPTGTGAGSTTRGAACVPSSRSATGSSCLETICSLPALANRSGTDLVVCGSPADAGMIFVGVEVSAVITGGGCIDPGVLT